MLYHGDTSFINTVMIVLIFCIHHGDDDGPLCCIMVILHSLILHINIGDDCVNILCSSRR